MDDEIKIICDDLIKEKLRPFLDDLLTEDEYRAFNDHIKICDKCNTYVRSIGSLSNQLWKLGKVRVPSDLSSTILHKIDHPEQRSQPSVPAALKKYIAAGLIFILLAATIFLGIKHFKNQQKVNETDGVPIVRAATVEIIQNSNSPSDNEAQFLLKSPEAITPEFDMFKKDVATEGISLAGDIIDKEALIVNESSAQERESADDKVIPLHWHFQYSQENNNAKLEDLLERIKQQKKLLKAESDKIEEKVFLLEAEKDKNRLKLGERYSVALKATKLAEEDLRELEIQKQVEGKKQLKAAIVELEEAKRRLELNQQQKLKEETHKPAVHKIKILNIFSIFGIIPDYKDDNLFVFRVSWKQLEDVRKQIIFASQGASTLRDFTKNEELLSQSDVTEDAAIPSQKEYLISMYFQKKGISALHWHINFMDISQMSDLFSMIETKRTSVDYESGRLIVFSVPREEVETLRAQMRTAEAGFSEFGYEEFKKSQLSGISSGPVKISIFFTEK